MFVYPTRQSPNIFRSSRLQTRKRMWMFGPATWICLPGNGWEEQSPWMSPSLARWLGGGPIHCPLTGMDKGSSSVEKTPARLRSAPRHSLGLCHWLPPLKSPSQQAWDSRTLESKDKQMAGCIVLAELLRRSCCNSLLGKLRLREAHDLASVTQQGLT